MSLVATYVQSAEGHWYADPTICGEDWFICYDDNDPIELVIKKKTGTTANDVLAELKSKNWHLTVLCKSYEGAQRIFNKNFETALSYFLTEKKGRPTDELLKGNKRLSKMPEGQGVYYGRVGGK